MKLSEYIELLKTYPQDLEVYQEYDSNYDEVKKPSIRELENAHGYFGQEAGDWEMMKHYEMYPNTSAPTETKTVLVINEEPDDES